MSKHVVVSFSRNNPITAGHQKLFEAVLAVGKKFKTTDIHMHMSQTADNKKNPLNHTEKVKLAKALIPNIAKYVSDDKSVKTIIDVFKKYSNPEAELHILAGSDRVPEYERLANAYNGKDYTYSKITVHSAGERDPDAEGTTGISGTKMREFAVNNDYASFKGGAPTSARDSDIKEMFDIIRSRLGGVKESTHFLAMNAFLLEALENVVDSPSQVDKS